MQREFPALRGSGSYVNMQNELAVRFWAGFMSVRSNTFKLGRVVLVVECLCDMNSFIYPEKMMKANKTEKYGICIGETEMTQT